MNKWTQKFGWMVIIVSLLAACSPSAAPTATEAALTAAPAVAAYTVEINPADFVTLVDNPYFPFIPGTKTVYEGQTEEGLERIEIEVLAETKEVMGITATVVRDTVTVDGVLVEDTFDWYAQDKAGNVWYLGEDVSNYENGALLDHAGSWEAGVDGALPGIVMFADPAAHVGERYQQEYYAGEAEDMAQILSVNESVTIPYGSYDAVVQTLETTPLEPTVQEHKFYAQGIGVIKAVNLESGETEMLVEMVVP